MQRRGRNLVWVAAACVGLSASLAQARTIIAMLDTTQNFGSTKRSVVYYDPAVSLSQPLFAVFIGFEQPNNFEDPGTICVNPATGDTYVLAFDSGTVGNDANGDTEGDYDLYRINFQTVYNHWKANGETYRIYSNVDAWDLFHEPVAARTVLAGSIEKIGEVARAQSNVFFDYDIEFVNEDTLVLLDNQIGNDPVAPDEGDNANDHTYRSLRRVSTSPGAATYYSDTNEGGWNLGTTESWESYILGRVSLDFDTNGAVLGLSEPVQIAYYKSGDVEGVWVLESDGGGDDVAFFQIVDYNRNPVGNGYRELDVGPGPTYPTSFALDNDPLVNPSSNDGRGDWIMVDSRGNLLIGESGFSDVPQTEPKVIKRAVDFYDNGEGRIDFGAWDVKGPLDLTGLPDDDTAVTGGRFVALDEAAQKMYYFDADSGSVPAVIGDVYILDLVTGATSLGIMDGPNHFFMRVGIRTIVVPECNNPAQDVDGDGDVDLADFGTFLACFNGPSRPYAAAADQAACKCLDSDADQDVDLSDFSVFLSCFNGPNRAPAAGCP